MTKEAILIAMAEALDWKWTKAGNCNSHAWFSKPDERKTAWAWSEKDSLGLNLRELVMLAERAAFPTIGIAYADTLYLVINKMDKGEDRWKLFMVATAKPEQRAEAFLRVKGLWTD